MLKGSYQSLPKAISQIPPNQQEITFKLLYFFFSQNVGIAYALGLMLELENVRALPRNDEKRHVSAGR